MLRNLKFMVYILKFKKIIFVMCIIWAVWNIHSQRWRNVKKLYFDWSRLLLSTKVALSSLFWLKNLMLCPNVTVINENQTQWQKTRANDTRLFKEWKMWALHKLNRAISEMHFWDSTYIYIIYIYYKLNKLKMRPVWKIQTRLSKDSVFMDSNTQDVQSNYLIWLG